MASGRLKFEALILAPREANLLATSDSANAVVRVKCFAPNYGLNVPGVFEIEPTIGLCSFIRDSALPIRRGYRSAIRFLFGFGALGLSLIAAAYFMACGEYDCPIASPEGALLVLADGFVVALGVLVSLVYAMHGSVHRRLIEIPPALRDAMRATNTAYAPAEQPSESKSHPVRKAARTAVVHTLVGPIGGAMEKAFEIGSEFDHASKEQDARTARFPSLWNAILGNVYDIHRSLTGRDPTSSPGNVVAR